MLLELRKRGCNVPVATTTWTIPAGISDGCEKAPVALRIRAVCFILGRSSIVTGISGIFSFLLLVCYSCHDRLAW